MEAGHRSRRRMQNVWTVGGGHRASLAKEDDFAVPEKQRGDSPVLIGRAADDIAVIVHVCLNGVKLKTDTKKTDRKARIDALLLGFQGVSAREINGLGAYFVNDRMFACISGEGIGLRLPVAAATELQFSRNDVVPFQPRGITSTREWIQINRADADEYEKDRALFQASIDFVKATRSA